MTKAKKIVEYVCQWVETAGTLSGKRGERHLSFSLLVNRDGDFQPRPAYEAIVAGVERIMNEPTEPTPPQEEPPAPGGGSEEGGKCLEAAAQELEARSAKTAAIAANNTHHEWLHGELTDHAISLANLAAALRALGGGGEERA
jgi:hypothetical protein